MLIKSNYIYIYIYIYILVNLDKGERYIRSYFIYIITYDWK